MSNYLKKILFVILVMMMPSMNSVSNAMDHDEQNPYTSTCRMRVVSDDQKNTSSLVKHSTSLEASQEDLKNSWASYVSSSVSGLVKVTYDVMAFTTRNPKAAFVFGSLWFLSSPVAAACACYCGVQPKFYGCQLDSGRCGDFCRAARLPNPQCFSGDKGC